MKRFYKWLIALLVAALLVTIPGFLLVRKHRAVSIGMPRLRSIARSLTSETKGQAP